MSLFLPSRALELRYLNPAGIQPGRFAIESRAGRWSGRPTPGRTGRGSCRPPSYASLVGGPNMVIAAGFHFFASNGLRQDDVHALGLSRPREVDG